MTMITIADDNEHTYIFNSDDYVFAKLIFDNSPADNLREISCKSDMSPDFHLYFNTEESMEKVWDRLCEITGARDIFDVEIETKSKFNHVKGVQSVFNPVEEESRPASCEDRDNDERSKLISEVIDEIEKRRFVIPERMQKPAPRENRGIVTKDGLKKPSEIKTKTSVSAPPPPPIDPFKRKGIGLMGFKKVISPQRSSDACGRNRCQNCNKSLKPRYEIKIGSYIYCKKCAKKIPDEAKREFVDDDDWGVKGI